MMMMMMMMMMMPTYPPTQSIRMEEYAVHQSRNLLRWNYVQFHPNRPASNTSPPASLNENPDVQHSTFHRPTGWMNAWRNTYNKAVKVD